MRKFKIGDPVRTTLSTNAIPVGATGVIIDVRSDVRYGVHFDKSFAYGAGLYDDKWLLDVNYLELNPIVDSPLWKVLK